jgi:hypothetical protein
MLSLNSGGVMRKSIKGCIENHGGSYVYHNLVVVWDSEIYIVSIWQCYQNKFGDSGSEPNSLCARVLQAK